MKAIRPWRVTGSRAMNDYRIFETRTDRVVSPRTGREHDVYIVTGASWVNVLAFTPGEQMILVRQYRHGTRQVMWEIPGGVINPGETPESAAARELVEETGYSGNPARLLVQVYPNPAFQTNTAYTLLILNAKRVRSPQMDGMEDIAVRLVPEREFDRMIRRRQITHALVIVADLWRRLWRSGKLRVPNRSTRPGRNRTRKMC